MKLTSAARVSRKEFLAIVERLLYRGAELSDYVSRDLRSFTE